MEFSPSDRSLIDSVASTVTLVTDYSTDESDHETTTICTQTVPQNAPQQSTRFYIGDYESSQELSSSPTLTGRQLTLGGGRNAHQVALSINNNNSNASHYGHAHLEHSEEEDLLIRTTELMATSAAKLSGSSKHNSFDSGYGLILPEHNSHTSPHKHATSRFISCDSEAAIIGNAVYDSLECGNGGDSGNFKTSSDNSGYTSTSSSNFVNYRALFTVLAQVALAIVFSAGGNFGAGLILDKNQKWAVFARVPELFYLVPTLLGLKGNLEMTMVARLSTLANMGKLNSWAKICWAALTNLATVQCQATLISVLASVVTFVIARLAGNPSVEEAGVAWFSEVTPDGAPIDTSASAPVKVLVIFATSLATANVACFASSILMILLIVLFSNLNLNPDNFATAVAASFGDIVTSWLLCDIGQYIFTQTVWTPESFAAYIASENPATVLVSSSVAFYQDLRSPTLALVLIVAVVGLTPLWVYYACRNKHTRAVLLGVGAWTPILAAMCISFVSGFLLRFGASMFAFMALFQPLINGVGGNLAAITTSRMSTELHQEEGQHPHHHVTTNTSSMSISTSTTLSTISTPTNSKYHLYRKSLAQSLRESVRSFLNVRDQNNIFFLFFLVISLAVQLGYGYMLPVVNHYGDRMTVTFYLLYAAACTAQVFILLIFTRLLVHRLWDMQLDPDTCAIPILTAVGDLLGTLFLLSILLMLRSIGDSAAFSAVSESSGDNALVHSIGASAATSTISTLLGGAAQFVTYSSV